MARKTAQEINYFDPESVADHIDPNHFTTSSRIISKYIGYKGTSQEGSKLENIENELKATKLCLSVLISFIVCKGLLTKEELITILQGSR